MKVRYAIGGIAIGALLAVPSGAAAAGGQVQQLSAQQCARERADIGKTAFRKKYGDKHQMRACVKRTRGKVRSALSQAGQDCQDELTQNGLPQFIDDYGSDDTGSDAMEECVAEDSDSILNPGDYVDDGSGDDSTD